MGVAVVPAISPTNVLSRWMHLFRLLRVIIHKRLSMKAFSVLSICIFCVLLRNEGYSKESRIHRLRAQMMHQISVEKQLAAQSAKLAEPRNAVASQLETTTVWVVSHSRSGTHMLIDAVSQAITGPLQLVKAAHIVPQSGNLDCSCLTYIQAHGKLVHPYRDVRDVVVSTYHHRVKFDKNFDGLSMEDYLRNGRNFMTQTVNTWAASMATWSEQPDVLHVNFDELVLGLPYVYEEIAHFLNRSVRDPTLNPMNISSPSSVAVSRGVGKGSGGWQEVMSEESSNHVLELAKSALVKFKQNALRCKPQHEWDMGWARRVGDGELSVPKSCPADFERMPVVRTSV